MSAAGLTHDCENSSKRPLDQISEITPKRMTLVLYQMHDSVPFKDYLFAFIRV